MSSAGCTRSPSCSQQVHPCLWRSCLPSVRPYHVGIHERSADLCPGRSRLQTLRSQFPVQRIEHHILRIFHCTVQREDFRHHLLLQDSAVHNSCTSPSAEISRHHRSLDRHAGRRTLHPAGIDPDPRKIFPSPGETQLSAGTPGSK